MEEEDLMPQAALEEPAMALLNLLPLPLKQRGIRGTSYNSAQPLPMQTVDLDEQAILSSAMGLQSGCRWRRGARRNRQAGIRHEIFTESKVK